MGKALRTTDDGLPILEKDTTGSDITVEGLPIIKKKESTAGSVSPSASSPNPEMTAPPVDTSGSDQKQLTQNYKNNSLTPKDVSDQPLGLTLGPSPEQISHAINNKGENIRKISKAPTVTNITKDVSELQAVLKQKEELERLQKSAYRMGNSEEFNSQMNVINAKEKRIRTSIGNSYEAQKKYLVPELVDNIKDNFGGASWNEIYDNEKKDENGISSPVSVDSHLKWDSETNKLTPKSVEWVLKNTDALLNKKGDDVVNAQVSGDLDKKERNYFDLGNAVVGELNKVPVHKKQDEFTEKYAAKNPKFKEAIDAQKRANEYFSKENVDAIKAKVNVDRDKEFIKTQERYYGPGGIFQENKDYVGIQEKYAQLVADGKMTEEVAKKQIEAEIKQNPALKKINDNRENEIKKINEHTQTHWQDYLIQGLQKNNPNLTVYKDGTVGVAGLSKDQYTNMMEGYEEGMDSIAKKMLGEQGAAEMKQANEKAKKQGAFVGSLLGATNEMASGFSKFIFNKTQWGGERVRHFEANEIAAPDINQSDVAATWNWKGIESLKDPNFWMSKIGAMVPVIAGTVAIGAATEGEGIPAYVSWLSSAGLFTAQSGLSTYNQLLNTRDAQGNLLTESDAAHFMARDMEKNFLPNVLMMAATSGTLLRAKNIIKPTLAGAVGKGIAGAVIAQPFFTWQGYESYTNMLEAQGKKADFWDYMQSKDFKNNLVNGMIVGSGLSLLHAPGHYMKSMGNWEKIVHTSEGEFRNLIPQNYALQQEMAGGGNSLRDALKLHIFNTDPETLDEAGKRELADKKNMLLYSVNLDRNIKSANLDPTKINDLYQAHNLALADQHDFLAEQNKDNKSLSSLYSDKAKEYREQAKAVVNGEAKFHYLTTDEGQPIFMSDKSFKVLDQEGAIGKWIIDQTIHGVHSSEEPDFAQRYRDHIEAKNEAQVEGNSSEDHAINLIEENKDKLGVYYKVAKNNPQAFFKEISDQIFGRNADGSTSLRPDAEIEARTQYGDDIVDLAKVMFPLGEKSEGISENKSGPKQELGGEYKPTIRDDYFAQSDFFTPEEKEKFAKLSEAEQDKMIDDKRAELKASPEDNIPVSEMVGKPVIYKGKRGMLSQDGKTFVFKEEGTNKEYEIGNADKLGDKSAKELGIGTEKSVVDTDPEGNLTVRGKKYINPFEERGQDPTDAILYDKDGNVVNVRMKTPEGERRTFTGPVAEDLAYQIHLKEISKNNEQPALEEFINSDEPTRKEIENGGLGETPEEKPVVNTEEVSGTPREKETIKSDKNETEKTNEAEKLPKVETKEGAESQPTVVAGAAPSPIRPVAEAPKEEFTAIRKEKNKEIAGAKELFEKQKKIKWSQTYENALSNVQALYPEKGLYDAMKSRVNEFVTRLDNKVLFNPTSEDNAVFAVFKDLTLRKMGNVQGWDSTDLIQRLAAQTEFANLNADLYNVVRVTNPEGEAGRAFAILQSEVANDPEHGLQIRRMDLMKSKGGEPLTEKDLEFTAEQWEKERAIIERENELNIQKMKEKFDKELAKAKADSGKAKKPEKFNKDRAGKVAESLKTFADKLEKFGQANLPEGTQRMGANIQKNVADAIRWIADKIASGDIRIPDIISAAIEKFKEAGTDEKELRGYINKGLTEAGLDEKLINEKSVRETSIAKIKDLAKANNVTDITNDMVAKNLIRDYVKSHIGLSENKDIIGEATAGLQKVLPNVDESTLRKAYLKEDEFKQPTKKELETGLKQAERSFTRLTKLDKDITDLREKRNLYRRGNNKSETPFDKDIEAKEKEQKILMDLLNVKTSSEDKYTKATYDQRAKTHNDRLEDLGKTIQDKLDKGDVSEETKKALIKLKGQLDASKIKLDPNSAISQDKTLEGGLSILKAVKSEFTRTTTGDIAKIGDINKALQKTIDKFSSDKEESVQDIKLQRAKDQAKRDMESYFQKISKGEFEDEPIVGLTKTDAELIKLERDKGAIQQLYRDKKREYEKQNKTKIRRVFDFARAAMVDWMIGSPMTLLKVGASAIIKPNLEALTKLTVGKGYAALPFETTKAITEQAKLGGESLSNKAIKKAYEAQFMQYGKDKMAKMYEDANSKYEKSSQQYHEFRGDFNIALNSGAKNDADMEIMKKELGELKNKRDNDLIDAVGQSMYQFIAGSSVREAMEVLLHRSAQIERSFGDFDREAFKKGGLKSVATALDNLEYTMNFVGRSHAALKNFSARAQFASGFMARLEGNVANGVDVSSPEKILEIAHASYLDFERGKYQESNWFTDTWNKVTNAVEKASPELAFLMRSDVAITRVPVNILREGIMEYTLGAFRGAIMSGREYYKAKGIVLQDGYTPENEAQFKKELQEQLQKIDPDKAATILRAFRKGGFGLGLYGLALLGHAAFGGWAHKGQSAEDAKKRKREAETGIPELETGGVQIGDWKMPEWAAKVAEHTSVFYPFGFGLGLSKVYGNNITDGKSTMTSATNSAMAQIEHVAGSLPMIDKVVLPLAAGALKNILPSGQWDDVDQEGNPMKRKVFHMSDYENYLHIPYTEGFKKDVLSEKYYKQAVETQKSYRQDITDIMINTSLSPKEKEEQRKEKLKELDEKIAEIYEQNKENPQ